jgi:zinc transport system substrate-binding protein
MTPWIAALASAIAIAGASCGADGGEGATTGAEREIVAAFYPLAFAAERIADDATAVRNLTPPGAEPHDFELSPRDVEAVRSADVVVYLGSGFQPALEEAVDGADGEAVDVLSGLTLAPAAKAEHGHDDESREPADDEESEQLDPHVWLDPLLFAQLSERIGQALDRPEQAATFAAELRRLDAEIEAGLRVCKRRKLVTSHAAFGYFARRYGLEQIPIAGLSPETEPTAQELEQIVRAVEESGATTVFYETLLSPRLAETVARETGADPSALNPLEGLTQDELDDGENYFTVMRANLDALRRALGCR